MWGSTLARRLSVLLLPLLAATAAVAPLSEAQAASVNATVKAGLVKPLALTAKQDFDFGQIVLPLSGAAVTISVSQAGVRTCPAPASCNGLAKQAIFNVQGSNQQVVKISAPSINLTNAAGNTLLFTPIAPATVTLTNSGNPGFDFNIGGSITVSSTTADGNYTGTLVVTADYQ